MYEPVELEDIHDRGYRRSAMVVLFGALYAFSFAMAKLQQEAVDPRGCLRPFCGTVCQRIRAGTVALNLNGYWQGRQLLQCCLDI